MAKTRDRREKRKSLARRRAETHVVGFLTGTLQIPEGVQFFEMQDGTYEIDIVPYVVGKGNPFAPQGELYYERTFWIYRGIGPEEKNYVCPSKTFGEPDYIQEYRKQLALDEDADSDQIKALEPKERQLFLVYDHDNKDHGVQLWEISYHLFGKLLDSRIKRSKEEYEWDLFYFPDEDGSTLRITVEEESGGGYKFNKVTAIDFLPRKKPLPEEIRNHGICLDDLLVHPSYEELKAAFLGVAEDEVKGDDGEAGEDKSSRRPAKSRKPETQDDDEDSSDEGGKPDKQAKDPVASDFGLERGDEVRYRGHRCTIAKISGDGTSLTLMDDEEDELLKAIGPEEVEKIQEKEDTSEDDDTFDESDSSDKDKPKTKAAKSAKSDKPAKPAKDDFDDEEPWDSDWD